MSILDWYLFDYIKSEAIGPFAHDEIIQKVRQGELQWDDYIWSPTFKERRWQRLIECTHFKDLLKKPPSILPPAAYSSGTQQKVPQDLALNFEKQSGTYGVENVYRRYPRAPLDVEVILHNNQEVLWGRSIDVSEKGSFIHLDSPGDFRLGQEVTAIFRNIPSGVGTTSTPAVIMRVINEPPGYGLFFLNINPRLRRQLASYVITQLRAQYAQAKVG